MVECGDRHSTLIGQHVQNMLDFHLPNVLRMPQAIPFHEHPLPLHLDQLSA